MDYQISIAIAAKGWTSECLWSPKVDNVHLRIQAHGSRRQLGTGSVAVPLDHLLEEEGVFVGWLSVSSKSVTARLMCEITFSPDDDGEGKGSPRGNRGNGGDERVPKLPAGDTWFHE